MLLICPNPIVLLFMAKLYHIWLQNILSSQILHIKRVIFLQSEGPHMQPEASSRCEHKFMWFTSAACAENSHPTETNATSCRVIAGDGYVYDFSSIKDLKRGNFSVNKYRSLFFKDTWSWCQKCILHTLFLIHRISFIITRYTLTSYLRESCLIDKNTVK